MKRLFQYLATGLFGLALTVLPVQAQDTHPHYMNALSQLQTADALLQIPDEPNITTDQRKVDKAVRNALGDCKHAAWFDGHNTQYVPPSDMASDRPGRLHQINTLLHTALTDLQAESYTGKSNDWRNKAIGHITEALGDLQQVFADAHIDFGESVLPPTPVH